MLCYRTEEVWISVCCPATTAAQSISEDYIFADANEKMKAVDTKGKENGRERTSKEHNDEVVFLLTILSSLYLLLFLEQLQQNSDSNQYSKSRDRLRNKSTSAQSYEHLKFTLRAPSPTAGQRLFCFGRSSSPPPRVLARAAPPCGRCRFFATPPPSRSKARRTAATSGPQSPDSSLASPPHPAEQHLSAAEPAPSSCKSSAAVDSRLFTADSSLFRSRFEHVT